MLVGDHPRPAHRPSSDIRPMPLERSTGADPPNGLPRSLIDDGTQDGGTRRLFVRGQIGRATSELQSLMRISSAVFCLKKKNTSITLINKMTSVKYDNQKKE